jgi:hypothetical protein
MDTRDYLQSQRDQIHYLQNALIQLENARQCLKSAKSSTFVLGQLDDLITDVQDELNDASTLM